jgi:hypothetical protein
MIFFIKALTLILISSFSNISTMEKEYNLYYISYTGVKLKYSESINEDPSYEFLKSTCNETYAYNSIEFKRKINSLFSLYKKEDDYFILFFREIEKNDFKGTESNMIYKNDCGDIGESINVGICSEKFNNNKIGTISFSNNTVFTKFKALDKAPYYLFPSKKEVVLVPYIVNLKKDDNCVYTIGNEELEGTVKRLSLIKIGTFKVTNKK